MVWERGSRGLSNNFFLASCSTKEFQEIFVAARKRKNEAVVSTFSFVLILTSLLFPVDCISLHVDYCQAESMMFDVRVL